MIKQFSKLEKLLTFLNNWTYKKTEYHRSKILLDEFDLKKQKGQLIITFSIQLNIMEVNSNTIVIALITYDFEDYDCIASCVNTKEDIGILQQFNSDLESFWKTL